LRCLSIRHLRFSNHSSFASCSGYYYAFLPWSCLQSKDKNHPGLNF
jgi:hypothetical protein